MRKAATGDSRLFGRQPRRPVAIAPRFLALFADVRQPRRRAFLAAYVQEGGHISRAKKSAAGGSWHTIWLRDDPAYRAAFERAKRLVADAAQRKVRRRAGRKAMSDMRLMSVLRNTRREGRAKSGHDKIRASYCDILRHYGEYFS